ncbi:MAG: FHA domain-containing protein [Lachnospiraceae bacterium]|nr:FHA domain-containing protein [Lachnospiraceae bacterium]
MILTKKFASAQKYGLILGIRGSGQNTSYRLYHEEEILIGRDGSQVQIVVKHRAVSRKHCGIRFDEKEQCYYVCDYSKNGTKVSGHGRLPKEQWIGVSRDSVLLLGNEECSFLLALRCEKN